MSRIVLTTAMCLMFGLTFTGNAEGGLAWFGFSDLCFELEIKGGPVTDGELSIRLEDFTVQVRCDNVQSESFCQPGEGNAGDIVIAVPAESADPEKNKGIISADGCIDLGRWDDHSLHTANPQGHLCLPFDNKNKQEVLGSAHVTRIDTEWVVTNTNKAGKEKVIRRGVQTCFWPGLFSDDTCTPEAEKFFVCPIDEESKK